MPFLMHIAFDNVCRLRRRVHYFEYKSVRFKLIQNDPRRWSDVLVTLLPTFHAPEEDRVFRAAGEFVSGLSWANHSRMSLRSVGGPGVPAGFTLRQAKCRVRVFPEIPFAGKLIGHDISRIADIENEQQRVALTLFREASSCNKPFMAFLLFWQVMEVRKAGEVVGWINKMQARKPRELHLSQNGLRQLPIGGRRLGDYLQEDCRHAIAHITRRPGKTALRFDDIDESGRMNLSARLIAQLAEHFIRTELGVSRWRYLVRRSPRGFPVYLSENELRTSNAYPVNHEKVGA